MELHDKMPIENSYVSEDDMKSFMKLKECLSGPEMRSNRNLRVVTFRNQLKLIQSYRIRGNSDDWKRCHVCGLCWLDMQTVAVNVSQLRWLFGKTKSLINTNFNLMDCKIVKRSPELWASLKAKLPILLLDATEMRRWTIRKFVQKVEHDVVDDERNDDNELGWDIPETFS
jgi:hypothetical protein